MVRVLVALDESPVSLRAAQAAAELFAPQSAEFLVINVTRVPVPWVSGGMYGEVAPVDPSLWQEHVGEIDKHQREEIAEDAAGAGLSDAEILVELGEPADVIARAADEHDVDVIVVGSHDKGFLRRLWDPSVADRVVHHSRRPVLVVSG